MRVGDAIYIPALTFHSGGCEAAVPTDSMLLSVALEHEERDAASAVVDAWRTVRDALSSRIPDRSWAWAQSTAGQEALRGVAAARSSVGPLLERFLADGGAPSPGNFR